MIVVAAPVLEEYAKYFAVSRTVYRRIDFSSAAAARGGLLAGMAAHGLFNLLAMFALLGAVGLLVFLFFAWKLFHRRVERTLAESPHLRKRDTEPRP